MKLHFRFCNNILVQMRELNEFWAKRLSEAVESARASGRSDVGDYLMLKADNDRFRSAAVAWLMDSLVEIVIEADMGRNIFTISPHEPHVYRQHNSNIVGSMLQVRQSVRCLSLEAGWTRTPADGIMRKGAMAAARIRHFGMSAYTSELLLQRVDGQPHWLLITGESEADDFGLHHLIRHFQVFSGE